MGAGGYRFLDFARLGAPLTLLCLLVAPLAFWWMLAG
jgi:di/tricarboxylate transporter